ncbi:MAG: radical SAM protein [Clostridiales bacterium]|nr:radical SAM protein [Clostridiales bacterium]
MKEYRYVYGPVPSRRMGISLGVSQIPQKVCNNSCIYCQLGRTLQMSNKKEDFYNYEDILDEAADYLKGKPYLDVITVVGEGEPTLYSHLGELITGLKKLTDKPVAVITNGALLMDEEVKKGLSNADIVLPSLDAYDEKSFKIINRPHGKISFSEVYKGIRDFSETFSGQLWMETMLMNGINDDDASLYKLKELLDGIKYDRLYINTPVRPPAECEVKESSVERIERAVDLLGGVAINLAASKGFYSEIKDDYEAVLSIIKRHPMNQHEIKSFLEERDCQDKDTVFEKLLSNDEVEKIDYKGYVTYRGVAKVKKGE